MDCRHGTGGAAGSAVEVLDSCSTLEQVALASAVHFPSAHFPPQTSSELRIGVVGATGAVGRVTLQLLLDRGYTNIRTFASWRSAGGTLGDFEVEEATPVALGSGDLDICLFSIGTQWSRELVPPAAAAGTVCIDKSSAFRLQEDVPLVVPEVNGDRALGHTGIIANPNCCTIPLTMVLAPLHDAAGLRSVRVATYQSVSGAGSEAIAGSPRRVLRRPPPPHGLGVRRGRVRRGDQDPRRDAQDPGAPRAPGDRDVRPRPRCRGPCGGDLDRDGTADRSRAGESVLAQAPGLRLEKVPSHGHAVGIDEVIVGRVRGDHAVDNGLALFLVSDNLRKGAALNAIQIAEPLIGASVQTRSYRTA